MLKKHDNVNKHSMHSSNINPDNIVYHNNYLNNIPQ